MLTRATYCSCLLFALIASACAPKRDLVYFSNLSNRIIETKTSAPDIIIRQNDVINITMVSSSAESNFLFASDGRSTQPNSSVRKAGYRVDKEGQVYLPLVGNVEISGLTLDYAKSKVTAALAKVVKNPIVDMEIVNFKITVIGEVNKPATFTINEDKINLLEALGMAGDMTVYGKRENVLVIRSEGNTKTMTRLNLNKGETLNSPYFNLQQNDIVYVEPDKSKAAEFSQNNRVAPLVISSISAAAVIAAIFLRRY